MKVEVTGPEHLLGDVIGDLCSRRGEILSRDVRDGEVAVAALVPLANMFGYDGNLHGMSEDRAQFTMRYDHYAPVHPQTDGGSPDLFPPAMGMRA